MELQNIGKRIREKRLEKSWSQEELAEKVNLSSVYIGMIERGEKIPRLETFIKIVNSLETSSDEILADVLERGYLVRTSKYAERIGYLNEREKKKIYSIIEVFLNEQSYA